MAQSTCQSDDPPADRLVRPRRVRPATRWQAPWRTIPGIGDFDGDGAEDTALLIEKAAAGNSRAIAVCLSSRKGSEPLLIRDPYVSGYLAVAPKGASFYNFETGQAGTYARDGISVRCCECCGATYLYSNGAFEKIIDSD